MVEEQDASDEGEWGTSWTTCSCLRSGRGTSTGERRREEMGIDLRWGTEAHRSSR